MREGWEERGRGEGGCSAWAFSKVKEHFIVRVCVCVCVRICSLCEFVCVFVTGGEEGAERGQGSREGMEGLAESERDLVYGR